MKDYKTYFKDKKITMMGLGLLGRGVGDARFLASLGAILTITDIKTEEALESSLVALKDFSNITYHLGGHVLEDFTACDLVIKAAGVPLASPFIAEAKKHAVPVRMSADLFVELAEVRTVGVTGTRGKSTTSHLIAHVLRDAGVPVLLGGNVRGVSTLALLPQVTDGTVAVLELDSWQLQGFGEAHRSPNVAVFTNLMPDHMNYYEHNMATYCADKANIFLYQTAHDTLVLGNQAKPFMQDYAYLEKVQSTVVVCGSEDLPNEWRLRIPGEHNRYNAALAVAALQALSIDPTIIKSGVESFEGVEGRLQFIKEVRGVKIYNDNNSTTPDATIAALRAVGNANNRNVVLIMGGDDKKLDMSGLIHEIPAWCSAVVLFKERGTDTVRDTIFALTEQGVDVYEEEGLAATVSRAMAIAKEGETVLYSPAFSSFGAYFKNEYDRNDQFNELIKKIV